MQHRFCGWESADCAYLAEDRYKWRALLNTKILYMFFTVVRLILILSDFFHNN